MLRIFKNDTKKTTTALIENSSYDALLRVLKRLGVKDYQYDADTNQLIINPCEVADAFKLGVLEMNDKISGTVTYDERDTYDEKVGESLAVKKAMDNHKRAFLKALKRWQVVMIKNIMEVSPETFREALQEATQWKSGCTCGGKCNNH